MSKGKSGIKYLQQGEQSVSAKAAEQLVREIVDQDVRLKAARELRRGDVPEKAVANSLKAFRQQLKN